MGYYQLFKGSNGQYYWNLRSDNHEPILQSEGYTTKASASNGIQSCRENSPKDERYERKVASNKQFYFTLRAANGEVIGVSEMYATEQGRNNGITSCKANGPTLTVDDRT